MAIPKITNGFRLVTPNDVGSELRDIRIKNVAPQYLNSSSTEVRLASMTDSVGEVWFGTKNNRIYLADGTDTIFVYENGAWVDGLKPFASTGFTLSSYNTEVDWNNWFYLLVPSIKGSWSMNQDPALPNSAISQNVNLKVEWLFPISEVDYTSIEISSSEIKAGNDTLYTSSEGWGSTDTPPIFDFGSAEQEISEEFYDWMNANASKVIVSYGINYELTGVTSASTNPYSIAEDSVLTLNFTVNDGYNLPSSVKVTNATLDSWDNGNLTISNPTGTVNIAIEGEGIVWKITTHLTNVIPDPSNPTEVPYGEVAFLYFKAKKGYQLPEEVKIVSGTIALWTKDEGRVILNPPQCDVEITIAGEIIPQPVYKKIKGEWIKQSACRMVDGEWIQISKADAQ